MLGTPMHSKLATINMYIEQLKKFKKIGLGNKTEYGVVVSDKLIDSTKKRLSQLSVSYEASLTPAAAVWRRKRDANAESLPGM